MGVRSIKRLIKNFRKNFFFSRLSGGDKINRVTKTSSCANPSSHEGEAQRPEGWDRALLESGKRKRQLTLLQRDDVVVGAATFSAGGKQELLARPGEHLARSNRHTMHRHAVHHRAGPIFMYRVGKVSFSLPSPPPPPPGPSKMYCFRIFSASLRFCFLGVPSSNTGTCPKTARRGSSPSRRKKRPNNPEIYARLEIYSKIINLLGFAESPMYM